MTHVAFESELRSVARSSMHPGPGNWVSIGCIMPGLPTHLVQELNVGTVDQVCVSIQTNFSFYLLYMSLWPSSRPASKLWIDNCKYLAY